MKVIESKVEGTATIDTIQGIVWLTDAGALKRGNAYYVVSELDMSDQGWTKVMEIAIPVTRPSLEAVLPAAIQALRAEQVQANLRAAAENARLEARIANLLALEAPRDL